MAENVLKLRVDSSEYDNKIKRATEGLIRYADGCRKVGGTLEVVEKETLDYVRALGRMETVSRTASGKLRELKTAFTELSVKYKEMTDAEKQSPVGKALAQSLSQLKTRIQETKTNIDSANKSLDGSGGLTNALNAVAGKFGLSLDMATKFGGALALATAAAKVAKDAFYSNESAVDEWGRAVEASSSVYQSFLNTLNTGDFGGFLNNIDKIIKAARDAYDELDRLGTMKTIQTPAMSAQQTENERMRMMLQTRRYIAPAYGRKAIAASGQLLTDKQIKDIERNLVGGMNKITELVKNEVNQSTKAIDAVYEKQSKELGMTSSEFRSGTESMAEFEKRLERARMYNDFEKYRKALVYNAETGNFDQPHIKEKNPHKEFRAWDVFRVDGEAFGELVQLIQERDQKALQLYQQQSQGYRAINRVEGISVRGGGGGGKTTVNDFASDSIAAQEKRISELQKAWKNAGATVRDDYKKQLEEAKYQLELMTGKGFDPSKLKPITSSVSVIKPATPTDIGSLYGNVTAMRKDVQSKMLAESLAADKSKFEELMKISLQNGMNNIDINFKPLSDKISQGVVINDEAWEDLINDINEHLESMGIEPIKLDIDTGKISKDAKAIGEEWKSAASAIRDVGGAMTAIEDPAARVMGIIAQAVATIALAFAEANLQAAKNPLNAGWGWLSFAATSTATMISSIAAIHSATGYAQGGEIKGNSFSGDNIPILANAGEVVLTRAMQSNLASQLNDRESGTAFAPYTTGENIYLGMDSFTRRSGKGEIVTTSTLRRLGLIN